MLKKEGLNVVLRDRDMARTGALFPLSSSNKEKRGILKKKVTRHSHLKKSILDRFQLASSVAKAEFTVTRIQITSFVLILSH